MTNEESLPTEISWTELTSRRTEYRSPSQTVPLLFFVSSVATKRVFGKPLNSNGLFRLFVAAERVTEPLPSNGHIGHNINRTVFLIKQYGLWIMSGNMIIEDETLITTYTLRGDVTHETTI
jgi:hypothetical protein